MVLIVRSQFLVPRWHLYSFSAIIERRKKAAQARHDAVYSLLFLKQDKKITYI